MGMSSTKNRTFYKKCAELLACSEQAAKTACIECTFFLKGQLQRKKQKIKFKTFFFTSLVCKKDFYCHSWSTSSSHFLLHYLFWGTVTANSHSITWHDTGIRHVCNLFHQRSKPQLGSFKNT